MTTVDRLQLLEQLARVAAALPDDDLMTVVDCAEQLAGSQGFELFSTLGRLTGLRMVAVEPGYSRLELPVRPAVMNPVGRLFGGASFTLADVGMVQAHRLLHEAGDRSTTLEMKINYLEAVDSGTLVAESRIIHDVDPVVTLESEIRDAVGRLIALARGTRYISRAAMRRGRIEA